MGITVSQHPLEAQPPRRPAERAKLGRVKWEYTLADHPPSKKETPMRIRPSLIRVAILALGLALAGPVHGLEVGDKAPDFALNGTDGKPVKLSDLTAKGPIVLYTFVAAFTPT
jgi:AhpC/TSA family